MNSMSFDDSYTFIFNLVLHIRAMMRYKKELAPQPYL